MKLENQKNKNSYFDNGDKLKIIALIAGVVVLFCVGYFWQKNSQAKTNYQPNNVEIEVKKDSGNNLQPTGGVESSGADTGLGASKVGDIIGGGTSQDEFYQAPSTEKLLEGKEINIK